MLTDFKKWTLLLCSISSILCLVAAFAPHWIYMQPESVAYGLYSACSGNTCAALNMTTLRTLEGCSNSDCAHPTQFHDRWWAVAAGAWMGVAWPFFAFLSIMIGFLRPIYKKGFYISLSLFVVLGLASLAMTVGVFGATFSFSSGEDVCSNANGCVYWGASAMVMFAALGSLGLAGICTIASWLVKKHRTAFLTAAMLLCLCTTCLSAGGACTGRWVIKLGQYENASPSSLMGTITQCAGTTCKKLDRDMTISTTNALIVSTGTLDLCTTSSGVKMPTASMLGSRMATVVAFHVIAVVMAVGAGIAVLPADPYSRTSFCFVLAHFVSILIGLSVYAHTFGSWIGCGQSYCTLLGSVQPTWACGWGVSFAVSVGAAFLSGVLVLAYTFDLLCGGTYTLYGDDSKMLGTLPGMFGGAGFNRVPPTADGASTGEKAAADGADGAAVAIPVVVEQAEAEVAAGKSRGPRAGPGVALDDDDAAAGQEEMAPVAAAGSRRGSARDNVPLLADTDEVEYVDAAGNPLDALMREAIARQVELDAAATGLGTAGFGATGGIRYPPGFLIGVANPSGFGGVGIAGGAGGGSYAPGGTFIPTLQLQRSAVMTPATARAHGRAVSSRPAQTAASSTTRSFSVSGGPTSPSALGISTPAAVAAGRMSSVAPQTEPAHNRNRGNEDRDYSPRAAGAAASAAPMTTRAAAAGAATGDAEAGSFPQDAPVVHSGAPSGAAGYSNPSAIPIVPPTKPAAKEAGAMPIPEVDATAPPQSARPPAQLPSAQATTVEAHAAAAEGAGAFGTPTASGRGGGAAAAGAGSSTVSPRDRSHVHVRPGQEEEEEPPLPGSPDTSMRFSPRGQDAAPMASPPK